MQFSLNHMVATTTDYVTFFDMAVAPDLKAVEIRNDIPVSLMGLAAAKMIKQMAEDRGLEILTLNGLQRFND